MTLSMTQLSPFHLAVLAGLLVLAVALLVATRRYLRPSRPLLATVAAAIVLALALGLTGTVGVPSLARGFALLPAAAVILMAGRPMSAHAWLSGAATLAVTLTLVSYLAGELLTTVAATAAAGGLVYLLQQNDAESAAAAPPS